VIQETAVQFFYEQAGWGYRPGVETEEQGRQRGARQLAEAEAWADGPGALVFEWEDDPDADMSCACGEDHGPAFGCIVRREGERDVLASLWSVTFGVAAFATDPYKRVVEAELALEVLRETNDNDRLMASNPELCALVAYAAS
jgi:hypothetical protein